MTLASTSWHHRVIASDRVCVFIYSQGGLILDEYPFTEPMISPREPRRAPRRFSGNLPVSDDELVVRCRFPSSLIVSLLI